MNHKHDEAALDYSFSMYTDDKAAIKSTLRTISHHNQQIEEKFHECERAHATC